MNFDHLTPVLTDAPTLRARIHAKIIGALQETFPIDLKGRSLEVKDLQVHAKDFSPEDQKRAILEGKSLHEVVKGTMVLKDVNGKVIDEAKHFTLVHVPYFTERHTVISKGNEYQVANMLRRKPGVYTQRGENGELHTVFNLSKGQNFNVMMNPEKGTLYLNYKTTNLPLYPILRELGATHEEISAGLGSGVAAVNEKAYAGKTTQTINKLYQKLVHPLSQKADATHEQKSAAVKEKYGQTAMDAEVVQHTLGRPFDKVTHQALIVAAKRLLDVHNGKAEVDDSDSLAFKTFHSVDDFLGERMRLTARDWKVKARYALHGKDRVRDGLRPAPFSDSIEKFITTSPLTAVPTGINPIELLDHSVKVTAIGEGGIPSERAVPYEARLTHPTHYGTLDPIRTPESSAAGIDLRATIAAHRDDKGNLYTAVLDKKGRRTFIKSGDMMRYIVAFPHQKLEGTVDAFVKGQVQKVKAEEVEYQIPHLSYALSPSTALIPMLHNIQGNRAIMGSKMQTQALPLIHREVPHVQVMSHINGRSFEDVFGHMIVPTSPVRGTIEKIEGGFIHIRPDVKEKTAEEEQRAVFADELGAGAAQVGYFLTKTATPDYPTVGTRKAGPFTVSLEAHKGEKDPDTGLVLPCDSGYVKGYLGPDGATLDFLVGSDEKGVICAMDKVKNKKVIDLKFFVEMTPSELTAAKRYFTDQPGVALENLRTFKDWAALKAHINAYFKSDEPAKTAEDRPIIEKKKLGPFEFNIEIKKGYSVKAEGNLKAKGSSEDYGHLPGYVGPDGDSLDFFVGNDPHGKIFSYEKQKRPSADAPWKTTDLKFVVGLSARDAKHFDNRTSAWNSDTVRFANRRSFKGWDDLKKHIDEHHKIDDADVTKLAHFIDAAEDLYMVKVAEEALVRVPHQDNFPFPSKTFLHHDLHVKPGQRVTVGESLSGSNFTRDGTLALGTNLRIAYMPYMGLNSNDAVVISEGAATKLTSEHMYREVFPITAAMTLSREKHRTFFGGKYQTAQYAHLDEHGVVMKGAHIYPKDLLVAGLVKNNMQGADAMLGRISKQLTRPYREVGLTWEHGVPGEVVEVVRTGDQVSILIKTREKMQIGDKLSGRFGNKGVVAKIIPDHEMLKDEHGNVIDSVFTSAGVVSRINPAQIVETAVAKVAEKTGKPIIYDNASSHDAVQWAKDLLKKHGIKDQEHVYDPVSGRTIKGPHGKGVLVGPQYIFKLFKSTDTNFSGHSVGPYDVNEQPVKVGGDESAKGLGKMEFDALLAHNARNVINESANIKGQKNDEFWRSLQLGQPLPEAKPSFAFNKFIAMMEGAGVKVDKRKSKFRLLPHTDKDTLARSAGAIQNSKTVVAKNLKPEPGGLFDPRMTGGPQGNLYSHIDLHEPVVNPVFVEPVRRLLGMTEKEFEKQHAEKGGQHFIDELSKIDVPKKLAEIRKKMVLAHGAELNNLVKQTKYLESLHREGLTPQHAYVISKVPVIPPVFRPIVAMPNDPSQLMVADSNKLYAHLMDVNHAVKTNVLPSAMPKFRGALLHAVGAVFGTHEVEDEELKGQSVKGFLTQISGKGSPKGGYFQRKLMFRTQDVSGRGTIVPDGSLHMDQIGLPEEMLWKMLDRLVVARLVRMGYDALSAREQVDKRTPVARESLLSEVKERPFIFNRAPTLHRYSMIAGYAVPVHGKTIRMNPFAEVGLNADYDGDTLQIHTPITEGGVEDAKKMLLSKLLLSDQSRNKLMVLPRMESVMGITQAAGSMMNTSVKTRHFDTRDELMAAYRKGDVKLTDPITVGHDKHAEESEESWHSPLDWTSAEALCCYPPETISGLTP